MKTHLRTIAFLILSAVGYGCSPADMTSDDVEETPAELKADTAIVRPYGEFDAQQPKLGELAIVVINQDGTFKRHFQTIDCIPLKGCWETGKYKFTRSTTSSTRYIKFYDAEGIVMDRYAYSYKGEVLQLKLDGETSWNALSYKPVAAQ